MRRWGAGLAAAVTVLATVTVGAPADAAPVRPPAGVPRTSAGAGRYVVTLAGKPLATYAGGVPGYAATKPARGRRVEVASTAAQRYRSYLGRTQAATAATVGAVPVVGYATALNGFAADLTPAQAERLSGSRDVVSVVKDSLHKGLDYSRNVDFLGLSGSRGVWQSLGGTAAAGRGVVVGVVDTGVWPESASFAGSSLGSTSGADPYRVGDEIRFLKSDGSTFVGTCQTGASFTAASCNTKLISARYFGTGWLDANPPENRGADEYVSPRDGDEHGTHTASTAAGDAEVPATVGGTSYGTVSGIAPAAKVAVYKALWTGRSEADSGGFTSDLVAAIDQAVSDGVDVINYSVGSGSESGLDDPIQLAFLSAASAGVFVAAAAGNAGPDASTLDNTSPWVTTVAASTLADTADPSLRYPQVAAFSSRGPVVGNGGDVLKPDLAAPGVDILAATSPNAANGQHSFDFLSGTSMATPQVAGLAALWFGKHPTWSPMAVKSALMTTATPTVTSTGAASTDAYAQGASNVTPSRMFEPGVVFDSAEADWYAYLEGEGVGTRTGVAAIDPSDLNTPSIAVGSLAYRQTVTRRITAVRTGTYRLKASVPGFTAAVTPSLVRMTRVGERRTVRVTFTRTTATLGQAAFGSLQVAGPLATTRLPVALTPRLVAAPAELTGTGTSGSSTFSVVVGSSGRLPATAAGLQARTTESGSVSSAGLAEATYLRRTVASGTKVARFAVDAPDGADVDLAVYRDLEDAWVLVGRSATPAADETVTVRVPAEGDYVVEVTPYADAPGTSSTPFTLSTWLVGPNRGNLTVTPAAPTATAGQPVTFTAAWSGLRTGTSYLGWVGYPDGSGTVLSVAP